MTDALHCTVTYLQALSGGVEGVRAWVCSWLVWSAHAAKDCSLPAGRLLMLLTIFLLLLFLKCNFFICVHIVIKVARTSLLRCVT